MYDLKTILLAKRFRRNLDITHLTIADIAMLEIIKNKTASNPVRDATITNGIATFNGVVASQPLVSLLLNIPVTQTGSGTPSPDNIRDFIGFSGVNVSRTGKNLWNKPLIQGHVQIDNLKVGATYTATAQMINATQLTYCYLRKAVRGTTNYENIGYIIVDVTTNAITFTVENGYDYYVWCNASYTNVTDVQIELGSTPTSYEPYTGNTYQISFGQTVYSANLDVLTGLLTITRKYIVFDGSSDEDWAYNSNYNFFNVTVSDYYKELGATTYNCNEFNPIPQTNGYNAFSQKPDESVAFITTNINKLMVKHTSSADLTEFKQFLSEHNMKLVYELAEPIEIDLTPTVINTLVGNNVIFADVANVTECKYTRK